MRRTGDTTRGFTLLELILVMAILAIVVAVVAPSLRGFGIGRQDKDAAAMVVSLANYARTQAVAEGRTYRLNFDPARRTIFLTAQDGALFQPPGSDFGEPFTLPEGMTLRTDLTAQADGQYVEFRPNSRTDAAHVWLTDQRGDVIEIGCESATELFRVVPEQEMKQ